METRRCKASENSNVESSHYSYIFTGKRVSGKCRWAKRCISCLNFGKTFKIKLYFISEEQTKICHKNTFPHLESFCLGIPPGDSAWGFRLFLYATFCLILPFYPQRSGDSWKATSPGLLLFFEKTVRI